MGFFEDTRYVRLPEGVNQYELDKWLRSQYGKGLDWAPDHDPRHYHHHVDDHRDRGAEGCAMNGTLFVPMLAGDFNRTTVSLLA